MVLQGWLVIFLNGGWPGLVPNCARRTTTVSPFQWSFQACSFFLSWKGTHVGQRAAVERGPSEGARSGSTGPTWVSFQSFLSWGFREHRGLTRSPSTSALRASSVSTGDSWAALISHHHPIRPRQPLHLRPPEPHFLHPFAAVRAGEVEPAVCFDEHVEAHEEPESILLARVVDEGFVHDESPV